MRGCLISFMAFVLAAFLVCADTTVNDITGLNPVAVERVLAPTSVEDLSRLVASHPGPISIGGGRYSQGGQTACEGCLFVDMRALNHILAVDREGKTITIQAGATWRKIQEAIDPMGLAPKIMQSYSNFTVGGSLSVNCHGRYVGLGPIVHSVRSIRLVLADGQIVTASRENNRDLFFGAIGGYGGLGIIVEATLDLADNTPLERSSQRMKVSEYKAWHDSHIAGSTTAVLNSATLYPPAYRKVNVVTSSVTTRTVTQDDRLASQDKPGRFELAMLDFVTRNPLGKAFREHVYDRFHNGRTVVLWRNFEASQDVNSIEPKSREKTTYVLQEYFIPADHFDAFVPKMAAILKQRDVNVINVAVRHAQADPDTLLSWAPQDVFSFVLYYEQGTDQASRDRVTLWTRELIEASLSEGGSYYLPYQIQATPDQFRRAYPHAEAYFALKRRVDPDYKFRNRLWEAYYRP